MKDMESIFKTGIDPKIKKKALIKGTIIASIGGFLILLTGALMPVEQLMKWGVLIFFTGLLFIKIGLGPYQSLIKHELTQNEIILSKKALSYRTQNKLAFSIPLSCIRSIEFYERGTLYGLKVHLNLPFSEKMVMANPQFDVSSFHKKSHRRFKCDFFFPYFTKKTISEGLQNVMHPDDTHNLFSL